MLYATGGVDKQDCVSLMLTRHAAGCILLLTPAHCLAADPALLVSLRIENARIENGIDTVNLRIPPLTSTGRLNSSASRRGESLALVGMKLHAVALSDDLCAMQARECSIVLVPTQRMTESVLELSARLLHPFLTDFVCRPVCTNCLTFCEHACIGVQVRGRAFCSCLLCKLE